MDNINNKKRVKTRKRKTVKTVKDKRTKQSLGIFSFFIYLIGVLLLVTYLFSYLTNNRNDLFGYTARIVATGSMEPAVKVNSLNIIKYCDMDEINEGDIICFNYSQDIIHRVVTKTTNEDGLDVVHTKGDANEFTDSIEVNSDMIVGKVVYTFNKASEFIDKYSIRPGELDGATLSKDIIITCCILAVIIWLLGVLLDLAIMA